MLAIIMSSKSDINIFFEWMESSIQMEFNAAAGVYTLRMTRTKWRIERSREEGVSKETRANKQNKPNERTNGIKEWTAIINLKHQNHTTFAN